MVTLRVQTQYFLYEWLFTFYCWLVWVNSTLRDDCISPKRLVFSSKKTYPYGLFGTNGVGEITTNCTAGAIAIAQC